MSKQRITKEFIIETFRERYETTGEIPKARVVKYPFSEKTVSNRFGSWTNALTAAGIPLRAYPPREVSCTTCGTLFMKLENQIKKSVNNFCSRSCSATHRNTNRVVSVETRAKTSETLKANPSKPAKDYSKPCTVCGIIFNECHRTTCSAICLSKRRVQASKISGVLGGRASQAAQPRRSKGEILFFELCCNYFGKENVLSNEQIFIDKNGNTWDADVIIPKCKIAICYNGIWHYQQIGKTHSLKQVQARDSIKESVIFNNGYAQYIIKDMGRFNELFVYQQFHMFIFNFLIHLELKMNIDF